MELFDIVALKKDFNEYGLAKGQRGTILEVYDEKSFEVEFCDGLGKTLYLGTINKNDLELLWSYKTKSYARNDE